MQTIVILPTYNEAGNIQNIITEILEISSADILVVDDNSPDGTGILVDEISAIDCRVQVLHRSTKSGLGSAYLAGFQWALNRGYGKIIEMDADGSHQPSQLPLLISASVPGVDLVIGSRWTKGGEVINFSIPRRFISRLGNSYARIILRSSIYDLTGGFRIFNSDALRKINLGTISSQGYCFQIELAKNILDSGGKIVEVPISFAERRTGSSKMSLSIIFEALLTVTRWGLTKKREHL